MKKTILALSALATLSSNLQSQTFLSTSGGVLADGTTYTFSGGGTGSITDFGSGEIKMNEGTTGVFTFSGPVAFTIDNWLTADGAATWSGNGNTVTWTGDSGSWAFTDLLSANLASTGSTLTGNEAFGGAFIELSDEWGSATLTGATTVSWSFAAANGGNDGYRLSVVAVPEPSSTLLASAMGGFFLLRRRRK